MKHAIFEDIISSLPHRILPTVQIGADYHTIHVIRKLLQTNARAIDTHVGGGTSGHLGMVFSVTAYVIVAPTTTWANPSPPVSGPKVIDGGTAAQLSAARHLWEENGSNFRT
jgi:hypothetical protein